LLGGVERRLELTLRIGTGCPAGAIPCPPNGFALRQSMRDESNRVRKMMIVEQQLQIVARAQVLAQECRGRLSELGDGEDLGSGRWDEFRHLS
jgi:hypothetical protein